MPPVVAAGAIAGAATIGGAVLGSHAQSSAAKSAAQTAADNTAANNALTTQIYNSNKALLTPYSANGLAAGNALNALLLGPYTPQTPALPAGGGTGTGAGGGAGTGAGGAPASTYSGPALSAIMAMPKAQGQQAIDAYLSYYQAHPEQDPGFTDISQFHGDPFVDEKAATAALAAHNNYVANNPYGPQGNVTATPTAAQNNSALSAFDQFRQGTNYNFRLNEGANALTSNWAAHGSLDSGAAERAIVEYGQNFASNELANYMDLLARQQATGLSAASAIAGVSSNYAGNIAASNTAAANAAANAALARGQASANLYSSIGSGIGQLGGAIFQNSLGYPGMTSSSALPMTVGGLGTSPLTGSMSTLANLPPMGF